MPKNYQISDELFLELMNYFLFDERDEDTFEKIKTLLNKKCDQIIKRDYYSKQYDESLTPAQREEARQKYLNLIGMHKDFRY